MLRWVSAYIKSDARMTVVSGWDQGNGVSVKF
jgi:hypothetical protein